MGPARGCLHARGGLKRPPDCARAHAEQAGDEATEATDDATTSGAGGSADEELSGRDAPDDGDWEVVKRSSNASRKALRKVRLHCPLFVATPQ